MNKKLRAIVCVDENWCINTGNKRLLCIKEGMRNFREMTYGKTVIMDKNTMMSLPNPEKNLANRNNIVFKQKDDGIDKNMCQIAHNQNELWELLKNSPGYRDPIVIGNSTLYKLLMPYCHVIHVTKIFEPKPNAGQFFPNLDTDDRWDIAYQSDIKTEIISHGKKIKYQICTYTRKQ